MEGYVYVIKAYSEPCQTSKIKCMAKIVKDFKPLSIFTKRFILDIWQGSEYSSVHQTLNLSG